MTSFQKIGDEQYLDSTSAGVMHRQPSGDGYFMSRAIGVDYPGREFATHVRVQNFDAMGNPVDGEILLIPQHDAIEGEGGGQVLKLSNGNYVVIYSNTRYDTSEPSPDVRGQIFDPAGNPVGPEILVTAQSGFEHAAGIVEVAGGFVVTWVDASWMNEQTDWEIRAQRYDYDGNPVGPRQHVNTLTYERQDSASITALDNGGYVIIWDDASGRNFFDEPPYEYYLRAQIFDANGERVGGEFLVNTSVELPASGPDITALPGGGFVAVWGNYPDETNPDARGFRFQMFDSAGNKVGGETVVIDDRNVEFVRIASFDFGGFIAVWSENGSTETETFGNVYAQIFDASGNEVGERMQVNTDDQGWQYASSVATLPSGEFIISWTSSYFTQTIHSQAYTLVADIEGNDTGETLKGTNAAQSIDGNDGNDTLFGLGGDDLLFGSDGNDVLKGGAGNDYLWGGDGTDTADYAEATAGVTVSLAIKGPQDTGGAGVDIIADVEDLRGSRLGDTLSGNDDANRIKGETGNDTIFGLGGNDLLFGDGGNDVLDGGEGRDTLAGGAGIDAFVFTSVESDVIKDWQAGEVVDISGLAYVGFELIHGGGKSYARFDMDGDGQFDDGVITIQATTIAVSDFIV